MEQRKKVYLKKAILTSQSTRGQEGVALDKTQYHILSRSFQSPGLAKQSERRRKVRE